MFKRLALLALASLLALALFPAATIAQDGSTGEDRQVIGQITDDNYVLLYPFEGSEGEVVVVEFRPTDALGDLNNPLVYIENAAGEVLVQSEEGRSRITLALLLPADDDYTIVVTRSGGPEGTSRGEFMLNLHRLPALVVGDEVEGTITNEESRFFLLHSETPLEIDFSIKSGDFRPELSLDTIAEDGTLQPAGQFYSEFSRRMRLVIEPAGELLILSLGQALFDFNFETVQADYNLSLHATE
jgi:hypothetical protein